MPSCVVCTNHNKKHLKGVSLHVFPLEGERLQQWLVAVRSHLRPPWTVEKIRENIRTSRCAYICSEHFSSSCCTDNPKARYLSGTYRGPAKVLAEDAVPTEFGVKKSWRSSESQRGRRTRKQILHELVQPASQQLSGYSSTGDQQLSTHSSTGDPQLSRDSSTDGEKSEDETMMPSTSKQACLTTSVHTEGVSHGDEGGNLPISGVVGFSKETTLALLPRMYMEELLAELDRRDIVVKLSGGNRPRGRDDLEHVLKEVLMREYEEWEVDSGMDISNNTSSYDHEQSSLLREDGSRVMLPRQYNPCVYAENSEELSQTTGEDKSLANQAEDYNVGRTSIAHTYFAEVHVKKEPEEENSEPCCIAAEPSTSYTQHPGLGDGSQLGSSSTQNLMVKIKKEPGVDEQSEEELPGCTDSCSEPGVPVAVQLSHNQAVTGAGKHSRTRRKPSQEWQTRRVIVYDRRKKGRPSLQRPTFPDLRNAAYMENPWITASANSEMEQAIQHIATSHKRKRGSYGNYSPEMRAKIAKLCIEVGPKRAAETMSVEVGKQINESTVRSIRKSYEKEVMLLGTDNISRFPRKNVGLQRLGDMDLYL